VSEKDLTVVTTGGLGDIVLLTAALRAFSDQHPTARITVACSSQKHLEILTKNPHIDRLLCPRRLGRWLTTQHRSRQLTWINYGTSFPSLFGRRPAGAILANMLGVELGDARPEIFLTQEEERQAKTRIGDGEPVIAVNVSAGGTVNKIWALERWTKLLERHPTQRFVQLGSADEPALPGAIDLRGMSLRVSMAVVEHAVAFVGADTFWQHVAAAFQKPAVVLFGPSTPAVWGHPTAINLWEPPRCAPCIDVLRDAECPYQIACMRAIDVDTVARALATVRADKGTGRAAESRGPAPASPSER
jgi:ADP-heptose:LPS heptosyltransferase